MSHDSLYIVLLIAITCLVTVLLRAVPFVLFGGDRRMPEGVKRVTDILPSAIVAVLVIYCVRAQLFVKSVETMASAVAIPAVVLVHLWRRNTLLSIVVGTAVYMVLIRI